MSMTDAEETPGVRTRIAVLGTLAELHQEPIKYDLKTLRRLVKDLQPDLLCAEIRPEDWQSGDLSTALPEYREVLVPLSRQTDIVIVPVRSSKGSELIAPKGGTLLGLRRLIVRLLNSLLRRIQRLASGPRAINSALFGVTCHSICTLIAWLSGPEAQQAWSEANRALLDNILAAVRRDPGRRVLVTVDCRRSHWLIHDLRRAPDVELVDYRHL